MMSLQTKGVIQLALAIRIAQMDGKNEQVRRKIGQTQRSGIDSTLQYKLRSSFQNGMILRWA